MQYKRSSGPSTFVSALFLMTSTNLIANRFCHTTPKVANSFFELNIWWFVLVHPICNTNYLQRLLAQHVFYNLTPWWPWWRWWWTWWLWWWCNDDPEEDYVPAAHVALHGLDRLRPGWSVVLHQKVAVFQQAAAPGSDHAREHGGEELDDHGEQGDDANMEEVTWLCVNAMVGILFYLISSGFLVAMSFLDRISLVQDTIHFWQIFGKNKFRTTYSQFLLYK